MLWSKQSTTPSPLQQSSSRRSSLSASSSSTHRSPLAPLDPQYHDHMALSDPDNLQKLGLQRQIITSRADTASQKGSTSPSRATSRRQGVSTPNSRRGSLPTINLMDHDRDRPPPPPHTASSYLTNDDLYADLSTFTFGASSSPVQDADADDTLSPLHSGASTDRTPRPSVLGPFLPPSSHPSQSPPPGGGSHSASAAARPAVDTQIAPWETELSDNASLHTFGAVRSAFNASVTSLSSAGSASHDHSRAASRAGTHRERMEFSSDEGESEYASDDVDGAAYSRRGSLPMAIPGVAEPNEGFYGRDREGSLATLRRPSRSLGNDLSGINALPTVAPGALRAVPVSEPLSRGDWRSLEEKEEQSKGKGKARQSVVEVDSGFDKSWTLDFSGGITTLAIEDDVVAPVRPAEGDSRGWARGWNGGLFGPRRSSAATVGTVDDPFSRQLNRFDQGYLQRRSEWSFRREKAEDGTAGLALSPTLSVGGSVATPRASMMTDRTVERDRERRNKAGMRKGSEEIWRCDYVGRFKVARRELPHKSQGDPSKLGRPITESMKPPQQQLSVTPFMDPYVKVDTRAPGPQVTIHKHSRATAFTIWRQYNRRPSAPSPSSPGASRSRPTIMLAPKHVQEQFTSTRTTSRLDTHGLLEDRARDDERRRSRKEREREREIRRRAEEKALRGWAQVRSGGSAAAGGSGSASETSGGSVLEEKELPPPPASAPAPHTYPPSTPAVRARASLSSMRAPPGTASSTSSVDYTSIASSVSERTIGRTDRRESVDSVGSVDSDDSDLGRPPTRTPHSETYGTVDPSVISERLRAVSRPDHARFGETDANTNFLKRLIRPLQSTSRAATGSGQTSASLEGSYVPGWPMMAPRSQQEDMERVVQHLNDSFMGVGLLPSKPPPKVGRPAARPHKAGKRPSTARVNIFEQVPGDSLYMLLPLWPGETDSESMRQHPAVPRKPTIPVEQRQYLLVYYKVFGQPDRQPREEARGKKTRSQTSSTETSAGPADFNVLLTSFHVSARLVGYHELSGSGVLAPDEGLSVTGPMAEALRHMPAAAARAEQQEDFIIGVCHSREAGMEFLPEGLSRMGLCYPLLPPRPPSPGDEEEDADEEKEPPWRLTPVGRAAVEMAWLGALALTSFGNM